MNKAKVELPERKDSRNTNADLEGHLEVKAQWVCAKPRSQGLVQRSECSCAQGQPWEGLEGGVEGQGVL